MTFKHSPIVIGNYTGHQSEEARIVIDWGEASAMLMTCAPKGIPVMFGLEHLDELLDALHEARRDLAKVEREKITFRIPPDLKDALEAKARRRGLTQNAAFTVAVEKYVEESIPPADSEFFTGG